MGRLQTWGLMGVGWVLGLEYRKTTGSPLVLLGCGLAALRSQELSFVVVFLNLVQLQFMTTSQLVNLFRERTTSLPDAVAYACVPSTLKAEGRQIRSSWPTLVI